MGEYRRSREQPYPDNALIEVRSPTNQELRGVGETGRTDGG